MPGAVFRAERFVFGVKAGGQQRKLFQCQFARRDGSIYVHFPYFRHTVGILSLVRWPAGQPTATHSLEPGGNVTSHLVKYSHHPDGRAHFSQDRKVLTTIKKQAVPLADVGGHLFTLHVQGFDHFASATTQELAAPASARRQCITLPLDDGEPEAIKCVAMLYSYPWLEKQAPGGMVRPDVQLKRPDGTIRHGVICSTVLGAPGEDRCLAIYCEKIPKLDRGRDALLAFIGGFDPKSAMNDAQREVSYLALLYPATNVEDLRTRLGSLDFGGSSAALS